MSELEQDLLADWAQEETEISVQKMDQLVTAYRERRQLYEEKKAAAAAAYHELEAAEKLVLNALEQAGKTKYIAEGVGTVSLASKSSYKTPKTVEEKKALFAYIQNKYGNEALINYLSIHSQSLNSFANKEIEQDPTLKIPGLETPTVTTELRFRKD